MMEKTKWLILISIIIIIVLFGPFIFGILENELAIKELRKGNYEVALRHINRALSVDQKNPLYYYNAAEALRLLGKFKEAIDAYEKASNLSPGFVQAYIRILDLSLETGCLSKAEKYLQLWRRYEKTGEQDRYLKQINELKKN
ncbi:MAG TPA: tetratricopeptide repeat protein [Thermotogaceae bacterium]|nr:tetratricopeptide repeat protein [Thermotogaceae bacterium]